MGTCCGAHLTTKVRDYAKNAQNGAVTVTVIENPIREGPKGKVIKRTATTLQTEETDIYIVTCDYCKAPAEFTCSYYPK